MNKINNRQATQTPDTLILNSSVILMSCVGHNNFRTFLCHIYT